MSDMKKYYLSLVLFLYSFCFTSFALATEEGVNDNTTQGSVSKEVEISPAVVKTGQTYFFKPTEKIIIPKDVTPSSLEETVLYYVKTYLFSKEEGALYTEEDFNFKSKMVSDGRHIIKLQQQYAHIAVYGAELVVHLDNSGALLEISGSVLPLKTQSYSTFNPFIGKQVSQHNSGLLGLNTTVLVNAEQAIQSVTDYMQQQYQVPFSDIKTESPLFMIFNPLLMGVGSYENKLTWQINTTGGNPPYVGEKVFVDVHTGKIVFTESTIHEVLDRDIYDNNNTANPLPGTLRRGEGDPASTIADVNSAYNFLGDTYNFYFNTHGRDSIDGAGMTLIATTRHCRSVAACPMANAFWNESLDQMEFGNGYAVDDVTAHEVTHGITNRESGLTYSGQSGAINESFSDVWGEFVDLTNSSGNDSAAVRWLIGEDLPTGSIRDMENPPAFNDPDRITSTFYYCGTDPSTAVHTNSGVNNRTVALMVDGGTFNGQTVSALGIPKTARIYYEAQVNRLISSSKYFALYNAMNNGCTALIGMFGITLANCNQVRTALEAVEMNSIPCLFPSIATSGGNVTISLDIGNNGAVNADYWGVAVYGGILYYLNSSMVWTTTAVPAYQGALANITAFTIYSGTTPFPSRATVDFYFGVDLSMNGILDFPRRYATRTVVIP